VTVPFCSNSTTHSTKARTRATGCRWGGDSTYKRHRRDVLLSKEPHQLTAFRMSARHIGGHPNDAQTGNARREVGIAVVDRNVLMALQRDGFSAPLQLERAHAAEARSQKADHLVWRLLELPRMRWTTAAPQVFGRYINAERELPDTPRDELGIRRSCRCWSRSATGMMAYFERASSSTSAICNSGRRRKYSFRKLSSTVLEVLKQTAPRARVATLA
jgi:hypothetical protein